jgi:predicted kinase
VGQIIHCPVVERDTLKTEILKAGVIQNDIASPLADSLLLGVGKDLLAQGFSVVLDGHSANPAFVESAVTSAEEHHALVRILFVTAPQATRNARLSQRRNRLSQSQVDRRSDTEVAKTFSHLPQWTLKLDGSRPTDSLIRDVLDHLER